MSGLILFYFKKKGNFIKQKRTLLSYISSIMSLAVNYKLRQAFLLLVAYKIETQVCDH